MTDRARPDRLAEAVRTLVTRGRTSTRAPREDAPKHLDVPSRLDAVERDVQEMRTRVNALFFAVITAGVVELVTRAVLS